ncbi:MAG TPA: amidohydrolase [Solirubrobacteraceae bacterium]
MTVVLHGGTVRTMDPARPLARSLVIEGDRIAALDSEPAGAERIDLDGGCVLPGFTDSHVHFPTWAVTRRELQLHGTRDDVLAQVAAAVPAVPAGRWLRGFGWTADGWEPSLAALDAVTGDVPVALLAHDWHSLWVNSAGLSRARGDLERPGGEVDLEAGVLREEAAWSFRDRFTVASHEEMVEATRAALPVAAARGVTAIHCKDGLIGSREVYAELRDELPFRVWQSLPAKRLDEGPDYVKAYMDGTLGSRTARLLDGSGVEITSRDEFEEIVRGATAAGVPVAVHAIGDRANRDALDAFAAIPGAIRPRIEHAQCLHRDDIPRFAALGVTASVQPSMAVTDAPVAERLWADRLDGAYAYRSLHAAGARLALGSDAPVEELDPLQGLRDAVLREWRAHEALDLQAALEALTVTPAWLSGDEDRRGRLRPGMLADLVILDRDPFTDLANAVVIDTYLGGKQVSPTRHR